MIPPSWKLLVFDLDGVLVDSSPAHAKAFGQLWIKLGIQGPDYSEIAGRSTKEVVTQITAHLQPTPFQIQKWVRFKSSQALKYMEHSTLLFPDTIPSLKLLAASGQRMTLGTAASRDNTQWILKHHDLGQYFSLVLTAEDLTYGKPDSEIYRKIMQLTGSEPEQTLIIEDSLSGLQAAAGSLAFFASVRTGIEFDAERFMGAHANIAEAIKALRLLG